MKKIIQNSLEKAFSYSEYRDLVSDLIAQGKSTGPNQSDDLLNYSKLNDKRMKRLDKTVKLTEETLAKIKDVKEPQTWLVLTEGWCGDAAQNLPVINKIAEENPNINLKLVLRDENLELMDEFLTNGGRSIPKLIALNKENEVINTWGPRPTEATKMVVDYKEKHGSLDADFKTDLQVWYNKNKGENTQEDLISMLQ
ncbi:MULTISPECIES: thioredoxin family protein [Tenacibaculum]|uniref:Thioredoxin family protein n=1 Tax=Tenacibaculum mesophilum TaxID=104268 RepID=A0AAE9SHQ2_9FLAO|nr:MULTISPECIES: thioredoxin family protein [Tenacibaculum]AZJ33366.1 thioredoxin family protein [Tenacibaculum mesophilum]KAF9659613.1 thioredoxin family protein [Tenacibaculum mesophilum]MCG7500358.1 thioredoxin family protein [Tenacibaculum sp. Mcav3-52]QFS28609.1 thioredoxin family protein [Tenacibaculum mesophilum]UTD16064.1 thioredoxin family protein [Tenacibaculum mesophilum]